MRVRHKITGLEGTVQRTITLLPGSPHFAGDLAGKWAIILWDDGFQCHNPFAELEEVNKMQLDESLRALGKAIKHWELANKGRPLNNPRDPEATRQEVIDAARAFLAAVETP